MIKPIVFNKITDNQQSRFTLNKSLTVSSLFSIFT